MKTNASEKSGIFTRLGLFLSSIAPGIFLIGYNIGTGSITTMASAGAKYGMTLTWALLISCVFTYILIVTFGSYTAITGDTALHSFRKHFGSAIAGFVLVSLLFSEWTSCMGVMSIVVQTVQEWSRPLTADGGGFTPCCSRLYLQGCFIFCSGRGSTVFLK